MNIYSFASLIASIFCLSLGIFVFIKRRRDRKCELFGIASVLTGLWTLFPFALSIAHDEASALFLGRLTYIPAIFTAPAWVHFMLSVVKERRLKEERRLLALIYFISTPFVFFNFTPLFIKGVRRFAPYFSVVPGPLYKIFILVFSFIFTLFIIEVFYNLKIASGYYKNQLKFILISYIVGVISGLLHFSAAYFNVEPFPHDFLLIFYTSLFAYTIIKHRLMDIRVVVTRTGIFLAVYTLVLGIPFIIANWFKGWLMGIFGTDWWIFPSGSLAILATVGPFLYIYLQRKAEDRLLKEQRHSQETLKHAAMEMTRIRNLKKLLDFIAHIVTEAVHISHSVIYLFDEKTGQFLLKADCKLKKGQSELIDKENPMVVWLKEHKEPLVYEEIKQRSEDNPGPILKELEEQVRFLHAAVVVPSFLEDRLLGILILGDKASGGIYTSEDLHNFSVLASEAALAIENASLYENIEEQVRQRTKELIEVQKQLVQAEKLATVGTLAGGVAHEINNPLAAILTNVQMLLAERSSNALLDRESLELIEEATKRCRTIVQKLMAYAKKPLETAKVSQVNLLEIINNAVSFLSYQLEQENIKIIINAKEEQCLVNGNQNELEQVVTNIVLNAKDAIKRVKKSGAIYISLIKTSEWIKIVIKDDGCGIPEETISKIFDPFFTTKDVGKGLGLGLSICQAIMEKHNGLISVQSEVNKGSVFTLQLPPVFTSQASHTVPRR